MSLKRAAIRLVAAVSAVAASIALTPHIASAAVTPSTTTIPGLYSSMAVDDADGEVFLSTPNDGSVVVVNFAGTVIGTVTGLSNGYPSANEVIAADNSIFVLDTEANSVDQINPHTLTIERTLTTGVTTPASIVYAGGALWTTSGATWPPPTLARVDITTGGVTTYPSLLNGASLTAGSGDPNVIFSDAGAAAAGFPINSIDVATNPPTVLVSHSPSGVGAISQVAVSPDGSHLVPAAANPYDFQELNTSDLNASGVVYPATAYPAAVAMTANNGGLFAGGVQGDYDPDVYLYALGDPTHLLFNYTFPLEQGNPDNTEESGVAFSGDGTKLFVASTDSASLSFEFHVFDLTGINGPPGQTPEAPAAVILPALALVAFVGVVIRRRVQTHTSQPSMNCGYEALHSSTERNP
jgi:hypothetical protein